jgi:pyrroline-5-carboxylate reductase
MPAKTIGFIGAGRVARIILSGWKRAGRMPARVVLFDCDARIGESLKLFGAEIDVVSDAGKAAEQDVVVLAVHPPAIKDAAGLIKDRLKSHSMLVSLAPKFTIAQLSGLLGGFSRIARMIPNAPSIVGRGYNPVSFTPALSDEDKKVLLDWLLPLGDCPEVDESHLEAYAILSAMGPTYFWPQIYTLEALGKTFGLTDQESLQALDRMLWGAVATIRESGLTPEQVQDLIPVKPLAEEVKGLCGAYEQKLKGLMEKIRP